MARQAQNPTNSRKTAGLFVVVVAGLTCLRAGSEGAMMSEVGTDPQMPIWIMFVTVKLILWFGSGALCGLLLIGLGRNRVVSSVAVALLCVWLIAICTTTWKYQRARSALAGARDPSIPAHRLRELVRFDGIQAGYELDNRLAANPNTPPDALRELYGRDQLGTLMELAGNPNTPADILVELVHHEGEWVQRSLERNPNLPESVRRQLTDLRRVE